MIQDLKEKTVMRGVYTIKKAFLETKEHFALDRKIYWLQKFGFRKKAQECIDLLNRICRVEVYYYDNLIPTAGRAALASWLTSGSPTPASLRLNYTALGTGANAPANGDTQLQTETYRKAISSATSANNIAYATAFYTAIETSGTFTEAGVFMNGSAGANTGTLFSRVAVSITKTTSTTLTIDYTITIS